MIQFKNKFRNTSSTKYLNLLLRGLHKRGEFQSLVTLSHLYGGISVAWQFEQFTFCMVENFIFVEGQICLKKKKLLHLLERKKCHS